MTEFNFSIAPKEEKYSYPRGPEKRIGGFYNYKTNTVSFIELSLPINYSKNNEIEDVLIHECLHGILIELINLKTSHKLDNLTRHFNSSYQIKELLGIVLENTVYFHEGRNTLKEIEEVVNK